MENSQRKIIHIDMDAFYASVEQLDNPQLRNIPLAVGGNEIRGVISAASYEARKFGVRSAMTGVLAKKLCPDLVFVKPRFERYAEISKKIRKIFFEYTDLVEPLSLDEAYLDVTTNKKNIWSATHIAQEIRYRIYQETGLTASAGISINKFVAKIASDYNKPNGQKTVKPEEIESFIAALDIRKFYGIGKVTADKMYQLGIFTGKDLKTKDLNFLEQHFGNQAEYYFNMSRGISHSPVVSERQTKSVATEYTFDENLSSEIYLEDKIKKIAKELSKRLKKYNLAGKTITLKIKYSDFTLQTRSKTLKYFVSNAEILEEEAKSLLYQEKLKNSVRLLGISISNLNNQPKTEVEVPMKNLSVQLRFEF